MLYTSTRDTSIGLSAAECMLKGLSDDGGLFVCQNLEDISFDANSFIGKSYQYISAAILGAFFTGFSQEEIQNCVDQAYNLSNFDTELIFPTKAIDKGLSVLELYSGPTLAFKDAALTIFPRLFELAKKKCGENDTTCVLTATSGDTGAAAMDGFGKVPSTAAVTFYPYQGVSELQLGQMLAQTDAKTRAIAVEGNFDDTQTAVKKIFSNAGFNREIREIGHFLTSANSINIGRLVPQIAYYYHSYATLVSQSRIKEGQKVNFVVPTGNFGDILAGYYAKKTGLPVGKLLCASNDNKVLTDFFLTGVYDKNRPFYKTISPSMDILVSSNLERLIFEALGKDGSATKELMDCLSATGVFSLSAELGELAGFEAGYASGEDTKTQIKEAWEKYNYLVDPHTACGFKVYCDYIADSGDDAYSVLLATASPFKFATDVYEAAFGTLGQKTRDSSYIYALSEAAGLPVPKKIEQTLAIAKKEEIVVKPSEMEDIVKRILIGEIK
ncbi:MAG: threonine synthase [Eubacteriaceae bacterium]|nr:threonine synthase [Eubacteriaceae bacterium]